MSSSLIVPREVAAKLQPQSCASCRFMHKLPAPDPDRECRRHTPLMTVLLVVQPPALQPRPRPFSSFPLVNPDQWCGEWEASK